MSVPVQACGHEQEDVVVVIRDEDHAFAHAAMMPVAWGSSILKTAPPPWRGADGSTVPLA